ncbi:MAG TPA: formyltransferase family protein [Gammaproteobacteria bacterium]|nr:formyltransferase family protein [Gammaproteobacteria bacterium]
MNSAGDAPRVLLLGSESGFCFHALKALRDSRVNVAGVLIASGADGRPPRSVIRGSIPLSQPGSVSDLAAREGIVTIRCENTREQWARELAHEMTPDVVLVACLPERLDAFWISLSPGGCFNLHPSMLPAYRGPAPLFWQLRDGLERTGVSVHRVEARLDAGPILVQEAHSIDPDDNLATLNAMLAAAGARAFALALDDIVCGRAQLTPQDEAKANAHPWPKDEDFSLDPGWSAQRAFRFVTATAALGRPYRMETADGSLLIERVLDFNPKGSLERAFTDKGGVLTIRFAAGTLRAVGKRVSA